MIFSQISIKKGISTTNYPWWNITLWNNMYNFKMMFDNNKGKKYRQKKNVNLRF
jgi:hypothetical protein